MNRENKNSRGQNENKPKERINLNDYYRKDDSDLLKEHSADSRRGVEQRPDEQRGESDDPATGEPNHI